MDLLDTISVPYQASRRSIQLFLGDLADLPAEEAVDLLVVSAFPGDYTPTRSSLIGALARRGISVADLATDKEVDLRQFSSCWLSRPLNRPDVPFDRILCFEPWYRGRVSAAEVAGDIFRCIFPFTSGDPPISHIALPLLASGNMGEPDQAMLEALVDAAVHWLSAGLSLESVKIVLRESSHVAPLRETFANMRERYTPTPQLPRLWDYDVFISYSWHNKDEVDLLLAALRQGRPDLRPFLDRLELRPGAAWQQHIFEALDRSSKVICVLSPDYLASKICQEEFNIAVLRHRESEAGVLLPLYLYTADLPTYMRLIQYEDAREGDPLRIARSAEGLLGQIGAGQAQLGAAPPYVIAGHTAA